MTFAGAFAASVSLADPPSSSVLLPAVSWLQGILLGSVATVAATLAIAAVGLMMLTGRLAVRPGLIAVLGCFILFGASVIAAGIRASAGAGVYPPSAYAAPSPPPAPDPAPPPEAASYGASDPHAGASVPGD